MDESEYREDRERRDRSRSRDRRDDRRDSRADRHDRRSRSRSPRQRSRSRDRGDRDRSRDRDRGERERSRDRGDRNRERERSRDRGDRDRDRDRDRGDRERNRDRRGSVDRAERDRLDRERDRERAERNRGDGARRTREDDLYRPDDDNSSGFRRRPSFGARGWGAGAGGGGFGGRSGFGAPAPPRGGFGGLGPPPSRADIGGFGTYVSAGGPMNAPHGEADAHARVSRRENRLYVGNLSYDCTYNDLSKFMSGAGGHVVFSEVLVTPNGTSKGCGIVEFETREQAQRAISELTERPFMGRAVFIREDREESARFGAPPIPGKIGIATGESRNFGALANKNIFVAGLPPTASWQDLKDLMRQAGEVIRADVSMTPEGRSKGNGTVVFVDAESARAAIQNFNGYNWNGSVIEVREDRFANMPPRGGRGGMRGAYAPPIRGGSAGWAMRGGFRGGFGGAGAAMGNGGFGGGAGYGGFAGAAAATESSPVAVAPPTPGTQSTGLPAVAAEPSQQIWVRNLPWSTTNEDLVELFETVGNVSLAEILFEGEQSKGEGIVEFTETREAKEANDRFMGYVYGGRPLDVQFNPRWHSFSVGASRGGQGETL